MADTDPLVLKGRLTTFRRRCGKPSCRCATGEPHASPALSFYEDGRTRTVTLRADEVDQVAAAVDRYEEAVEQLEVAARDGLARFRASRGPRR